MPSSAEERGQLEIRPPHRRPSVPGSVGARWSRGEEGCLQGRQGVAVSTRPGEEMSILPPVAAIPGTYALLLLSTTDRVVPIGQRGQLHVQPGCYVYVGSALGPGGVRARLWHHCRSAARPHWHIDYLRGTVRLIKIWYTYDARRREHQWAEVLGGLRGASVPMKGFGASERRCVSHLYFFTTPPSWLTFCQQVATVVGPHQPIYRAEGDRVCAYRQRPAR
jgi:Uri superfamily endonuclease